MTHVVDPSLSAAEKRYSYTLGLRTLKRTRNIYHSQEVEERLLDARWGGRLTIPEQEGPRKNPDNLRDNDDYKRLDPITWIEDMAGGLNTSEFELFHPTLETDGTNYYGIVGNPTLENNFLKLTVSKTGAPGATARGLYVKVQGNSKADWSGDLESSRIYKVRQVSGTVLHLIPGRLPWSVNNIRLLKADIMSFRLLNPNDIEEYLDYNTRGPWNMQWIEARR